MLEDWWAWFEGFFLYYPGRRQVPSALRAFHRHDPQGQTGPSPSKNLIDNPFAEPAQEYVALSGAA